MYRSGSASNKDRLETLLRIGIFKSPHEPLQDYHAEHLQNMGASADSQFYSGTTALGFKYQNGIILALDSRVTGKQLIASKEAEKIVVINKTILVAQIGCSGDCAYWNRVVMKECRLKELRSGAKVKVATASTIMAQTAYKHRDMGLQFESLLAGYDDDGANLYYVDATGHQEAVDDKLCVGGGAIDAMSIVDGQYKFDLDDEEAYKLALRAIYHATHANAYSGGNVCVYHIKESGWKKAAEVDATELHYTYNTDNTKNISEII